MKTALISLLILVPCAVAAFILLRDRVHEHALAIDNEPLRPTGTVSQSRVDATGLVAQEPIVRTPYREADADSAETSPKRTLPRRGSAAIPSREEAWSRFSNAMIHATGIDRHELASIGADTNKAEQFRKLIDPSFSDYVKAMDNRRAIGRVLSDEKLKAGDFKLLSNDGIVRPPDSGGTTSSREQYARTVISVDPDGITRAKEVVVRVGEFAKFDEANSGFLAAEQALRAAAEAAVAQFR